MDKAQALLIEIDRLAREIRTDALQNEQPIPSWDDAKTEAARRLRPQYQDP